ncbi:MAG: sigma 54-interacting transcriptional regulator [Polyangiaceae bacterium]|nr:sigma 54-interacting transcriptional regulator [Polyangiaceae bacterium]
MRRTRETTPGTLDSGATGRPSEAPIPGLVLVGTVAAGERLGVVPALRPISVLEGSVLVGRGHGADVALDDERLSREHVRVSHEGGAFRVTDLDSRNGTFVDGARVVGSVTPDAPRVLRIGHTLLLFARDIGPLLGGSVEVRDGLVLGPRLRRTWSDVEIAARAGETLAVVGESGVGKELVARHFHDAGPRRGGPFVAVNCAAIPATIAERLFFGVRRGAYSGADADAEGYVQAAHGGTLFLDELGELDPAVQAKLLRVVETREVLPLGATRARSVHFGVVCAAAQSLREAVAEGAFRTDLYYRIGRPEVYVPSLSERLEDVPWLADAAARACRPDLGLHPLFAEACLGRPWPGNVRELVAEVRRSAHAAVAAGAAVVGDTFLDVHAGMPVAAAATHAGAGAASEARRPVDAAEVEAALRAEQGNVSGAARRLGLHRNQLRRWLASHAPQPEVAPAPPDDEG